MHCSLKKVSSVHFFKTLFDLDVTWMSHGLVRPFRRWGGITKNMTFSSGFHFFAGILFQWAAHRKRIWTRWELRKWSEQQPLTTMLFCPQASPWWHTKCSNISIIALSIHPVQKVLASQTFSRQKWQQVSERRRAQKRPKSVNYTLKVARFTQELSALLIKINYSYMNFMLY